MKGRLAMLCDSTLSDDGSDLIISCSGPCLCLFWMKALDRREYHTTDFFPSLVTNPASWQPKYFIMDNVLDEWGFRRPDQNLFVLKSHFDEGELHRFVESQSWGPDNINISNVADLEYDYTPGGIHADDFLNWEYSISYVNNMQKTFEKLSCDGRNHFDGFYMAAFPVNQTQDFVLLNTTVKPAFGGLALPFEILVSSAVDQEQMMVTSVSKDNHGRIKLVVDRGENEEAKDLQWHGAPFECNLGTFPAFAPDEWTCDPSLYWNQVVIRTV